MDINIRKLKTTSDEKKAIKIYRESLGAKWPLDTVTFHNILKNRYSTTYLATVRDSIAGYAITQKNLSEKNGSLVLICILKRFQGKRIGTKLVEHCLKEFRKQSVRKIQVGAGGEIYLWPGVPDNLPQAVSFFKSVGFEYSETSFDLIGNLSEYSTPDWARKRIELNNLKFRTATKTDSKEILNFEKENFPGWANSFRTKFDNMDHSDILFAYDKEILGTVLLTDQNSNFQGTTLTWNKILGENMGGFGALGVAEKAREKGIGMTLAAKASEILKQRGVENCFLGWTWLVDWYAKLRFKVWQEYKMSWKKLT
ncbi:MAG: GNAT family N-acetyltransferase [Candidatus Dojkabacteria bacterium]|nr:GNAT family N-acetyltransferase [Candidatus Dojkabacteria bacterium]